MKLSYYIKRIINHKVKILFILFLFALPIFDLIFTFIYVPVGATPERADFNSFLAATSTAGLFHSLMLHFLPVFLLIIAGEDCFEDATTGYRNILISKWGKKNYIKTYILKAFCISFFVVFLSLMLNLLMAHIIYNGALYSRFDELLIMNQEQSSLMYNEVTHPLITNICYIFITAILSGVIGAAGAALAMAIKNRKIVYPLLFLLWYMLTSLDKSIMLALQPFCEYGLDTKIPIYLISVCVFTAVTIIASIKEAYYAKI